MKNLIEIRNFAIKDIDVFFKGIRFCAEVGAKRMRGIGLIFFEVIAKELNYT